jgi:hypothetical protein
MSIDILSSSPVSGSAAAGVLVWAATSCFLLAPIITERTALKIGWFEDCPKQIVADIQSRMPNSTFQPSIGCNDMVGALGSETKQLINMFGLGMACDALDQKKAQQKRLAEIKRERLSQAAQEASSKCSCAVGHATESNRVSLALHAGSARLIPSASMADLKGTLRASLHSPVCSSLANVEG